LVFIAKIKKGIENEHSAALTTTSLYIVLNQ